MPLPIALRKRRLETSQDLSFLSGTVFPPYVFSVAVQVDFHFTAEIAEEKVKIEGKVVFLSSVAATSASALEPQRSHTKELVTGYWCLVTGAWLLVLGYW